MTAHSNITKLEKTLLGSRSLLGTICRDANIDIPDREELTITQCNHCNVWHRNYKMIEDLDDNLICTYCEELVGL